MNTPGDFKKYALTQKRKVELQIQGFVRLSIMNYFFIIKEECFEYNVKLRFRNSRHKLCLLNIH